MRQSTNVRFQERSWRPNWISCASTLCASCRSMPCRRRTAAIRACRSAPRRWPMCCGRACSSTIRAIRDWFDRDRFVLSAGHGSMLLYSLLHLTGYDLSLDDIKQFRQWGSKAPGHPERGHTPGVEVTTGPLGQGFANAVGMAIAEAQLAARYNRPGFDVVDHATYAIVSDGDLMEGVAAEAASLAGHLQLGKLICLYDDNYVTLAAGTDITFSEDRARPLRRLWLAHDVGRRTATTSPRSTPRCRLRARKRRGRR